MGGMKMEEVNELRKACFIDFMPENIKAAYLLDGKDDYHLHRFAPFCHAYADYLLNQGCYSKYGTFIEDFNFIVACDELYQYYKKTQESLTGGLAKGLGFLCYNYERFKIKNKRVPVKKYEFEFESDMENELFNAFKDYFGNDLKVSKQEVLGYGKSDLTINDKIAIELKKGKALRKDVYQTFEYSFEKKISSCCLIAASFDEKVLNIARKLQIDCYSYSFIYEEVFTDYPIGFWIEKISESPGNRFDKVLDEMDKAVFFTNYDPAFNFNKIFDEKFKELKKVLELTRQLVNENKESILADCEKQGYDISGGLEYVLKQIDEEESKSGAVN